MNPQTHTGSNRGGISSANVLLAERQATHTHTHTHGACKSGSLKRKFLVSSIVIFICLFLPISGNSQANDPCVNCTGSSTPVGSTGNATYISVYGTIPDCAEIHGTLIIDEPTTWINKRFKMAEGSQILVRAYLEIDNCYLGTCDDLWKGILVHGNYPTITLVNSVIYGAEIGVRMRDKSAYSIKDTDFIDNYIGISTGSPFDDTPEEATVYASKGYITGCRFFTASQLPDPYAGHPVYSAWPTHVHIPFDQGYAAMYITDGTIGLNLGRLNATGGERNQVFNMRNGVIVQGSDAWILGTDFSDFKGLYPKYAADNTLLNYNQRAIILEGASCHIGQNTIQDVFVGVQSTRSSQIIADNDIELYSVFPNALTRGIDIIFPVKVEVRNNDIYNGHKGISVAVAYQGMKIESNRLYRDAITNNSAGISVEKCGGTNNFVTDNIIEITSANRAVGISLNQDYNVTLSHNEIEFLQQGEYDAGVENVGISGLNVYTSLFYENHITGTSLYRENEKNAGISLTNSMANRVYCNEVTDMYYGQWYIGGNMATQLKSNDFYDATTGLDLFSPVVLGVQFHNGNKWLGTYDSGFGAYISGPDPVNTSFLSQFIVDESDAAPGVLLPDYGPLPDAVDWFLDVNGNTGGTQCFATPPIIEWPEEDTLVHLIRHGFTFTTYEDEMNWMRKADILTLIFRNPAYLSNTVLDSFYDAEITTPLGELNWAWDQMSQMHGIDPGFAGKDSLVFDYLFQVRVLDSLIELNPINVATLKALRVLKLDTLADHVADWIVILEDRTTATEDEIENALDVVDNVTPGNDVESELQTVLLMNGIKSAGDTLTTGEVSGLYQFARQCPWLGARSMAEAQYLYSQIADSIYTHRPGICSSEEPFFLEGRSNDEVEDQTILLYPNPASDNVFVIIPEWVEQIDVIALDGRLWDRLKVKDQVSMEFGTSQLPVGIYQVRLQGEQRLITKFLSIVR